MNVVQTRESSPLQRHKQQIRETADKDEARAQELSRSGVDDLYTANDLQQSADVNKSKAADLSQESGRLRRNGREQSQRGLERLADGSDRTAEGFAGTEKGLSELKGSLSDLTAASDQKSQGLETAKQGLAEQAVENLDQAANLQKFASVNDRDAQLDAKKAEQLSNLEGNLGQREEGLQRQGHQLDSYLIAGETFAQGNAVKAEGFQQLQTATGHTVEAEALGDARDSQKLTQGWAEADQVRHEDTSGDLAFSSLFQSLKAKAESLNADFHKRNADRDLQSADGLAAQANDLRSQAESVMKNARCLQQAGQCHVALGRQMQGCPWSYHQGVCLERQGCAELAEAQRLKCQAGEMRGQAQSLTLQAEELRAKAEDSQARSEEFQAKSHGSTTRSSLLDTRSKEHQEAGETAGSTAERAEQAANHLDAASQHEKAVAADLQGKGTDKLQQGYVQQEESLARQDQIGAALTEELEFESELTGESQATTRAALKTVGQEVSFLGRGRGLLHKVGASHGREAEAQAKVGSGIESIETGLTSSEAAQQRGVDATKMLEEARDLELEGLRLQNRGQKMLLEARPKLAQSARLSAEAYDASKKAESQEEEAARLIDTGNQKIAAAGVLREKAAAYRDLAQ